MEESTALEGKGNNKDNDDEDKCMEGVEEELEGREEGDKENNISGIEETSSSSQQQTVAGPSDVDVDDPHDMLNSIKDMAKCSMEDLEIDAGGGFVLPGLIDAHVHMRLTTLNFRQLAKWSEVEYF